MSQNNKPDFSATCNNHPITIEVRKSNDYPVLISFASGVLQFEITEKEARGIAEFLLHTEKGLRYIFEVGQDRYKIIWRSDTYVVFERIDSNYQYQLTSSMAAELSITICRALSEFSSSYALVEDYIEAAKKKTHENLRGVFGY